MEGFFQAAGAVLVTVVLCMTLGNEGKNYATILTMGTCAMVLLLGSRYLEPVADFLTELQELSGLSGELVSILLKTSLIGIITEISALLCADGGSQSLGQALRLSGTAVILWISVPVFRALLDLVRKSLEGI